MLKIRFKDNKYNAVWLVEPKITIGRSATNALVLDDPLVSDVHLEVLVNNEQLTLKNLVPSSPVKVNDVEVSGACDLRPDDEISIGSTELLVIDPKRESKAVIEDAGNVTQLRPTKITGWSLKANHSALANRVFPLKELTVIGRANECDISLAAAHMSRRHAQLQVVDGMLFVKDLGSANGTFLNGTQVSEARVRRGDELRFDALSFGVLGPADDMAKTTVRKLSDRANVRADIKPGEGRVNDSRALETKASGRPLVGKHASAATRASSPNPRVARNAPSGVDGAVHKGRFGLVFLGLLGVIVVFALYLTRR